MPVPRKNIRSKIVLVTGAGRNIGKEIALGFARQGAKVAVCDIDAVSISALIVLIE